MKHTLILLSLVASIMVPLSARADLESSRTGDHPAVGKASTRKTVPKAGTRFSTRQVFYITNKSVTGSHLPLVVSRYRGRYDSMAPIAVYGRPDLDRTGQLSVAGELIQRDPAISSVGVGVGIRR